MRSVKLSSVEFKNHITIWDLQVVRIEIRKIFLVVRMKIFLLVRVTAIPSSHAHLYFMKKEES